MMNVKKIMKVATSPLWVPLLPVILSVKRQYRSHDSQRVVIGELLNRVKGAVQEAEEVPDTDTNEVPVSFEDAVEYAERKAAQRGDGFSLDAITRSLLLQKRIMLALVYFIFAAGIFTAVTRSAIFGCGMMLFAGTVTLYVVPLQFRLWQIQTRRLSVQEKGGFADFRRETNWWLDTINPTLRSVAGKIVVVAMLSVSIGMPFMSHAETLDELTAAADNGTDISRQAMVTLFGQIVNDPLNGINENGGDSLVAQILKVFSSTLLIVGTGVGGYMVLKKTAAAGHDGVFLDKEQTSFWMPVRVLAAFSLLTPLPNGWSLSSLLMLYAASKIGVGAANIGTENSVKAFMAGQSFVLQPAAPSTVSLSRSLFEANLCMYGINASLDEQQAASGIVFAEDYVNQQPMANGFIMKNRSYTCGGATMAIEEEQTLLQKIGVAADVDLSAVRSAHIDGLNEMQRSLRDGAQQFVQEVQARQQDGGGGLVNAEAIIQNASQIYENRVTAALRSSNVNSQLDSLSGKVADTITTEGWMALGSWYQTLAVANTRVGNTASAKGSAFGSSSGQIPVTADVYQLVLSAYQAQKSVTDNSSAGVLTAKSSYETNDITDVGSGISYIFGGAGQDLVANLISMSEGDNGQVNPMISMKNLGDRLIVTSELALTTYVGAKAVAAGFNTTIYGFIANKVSGFGAAAESILDSISPFINIAIIMLLSCGIMLAIYIPMIPFIIWTTACINYFVIIGEAIFASALWAFAHLLGSGEGMGQKTTHGYIFLLNLMFRPILMVGGFLLGGGIVVIGGTFLNKSLPAAMANAQFDSVFGIVTIIAYAVLYCSLAISIVGLSFSLINVVPDQVINWVGGHMGGTLGRELNDKAHQALALLSNKAEGTLQRIGGSPIGKMNKSSEKTPKNSSPRPESGIK